MELIGGVIAAAGFIVLLAALWRLVSFRNTGSQGLLRNLPADGVHGWRHGVYRYNDECLRFYKLRSLTFSSDVALDRRMTEVDGFRELSELEREIMPDIDKVLILSTPDGSFEFAGDRRARMALVSWLESAPHVRQMRRAVKMPAGRPSGGRASRS
ncbi:DUF2550 domain-containing protein [Corynebacterium sanguinis]|nr:MULTISPECIES: DUF2550 domain-containing protein [Corynebacterium]MBA4504814.1 DUF2550 domain-containing protein [Corynebacterium sanguinis]MCT1412191.1 DUF2550 domain-containing protein [Corynebacterium sanguinis]MCT1414222.1 DUF2550 domain-containing protein [Corynebacterium sanguinis]MCT1425680.1 DUF2550 domain-containing protein [Corynebacterium sanguinis]MCT1445452.1 DUF2550 domain-containing protein [Corynebacterium sanguinis]